MAEGGAAPPSCASSSSSSLKGLREQMGYFGISDMQKQERYEAVLHRTLERNQRLETRQKRWSWGGSVTPDSEGKTGKQHSTFVKQSEIGMLSSRRSQLSPLDSSVISRLLAPTQASLARSKSAATLSADGQDPSESHLCPRSASASSINSPVPAPKVPVRSRSIDRLKSSVSSSDASLPDSTQKSETEKPSPGSGLRRPPSPSMSAHRRSPSPANLVKCPPSPSAV
ncbi:hypothetical protein HGM15179_019008, partial [Zosterops borbonicus]